MPEMIEKYWAGQSLALDIAEMEFEKAFTAYEYTRDINAKYAELKVMAENGTEDDLLALYSEAAAESNEQKKGIFATFIEKIANLFRSIGQKITSFFSKKVPADKKNVEVSIENSDDFKRSTGKLRGLVNTFVSSINGNALVEKTVEALESETAKLVGSAIVGFGIKSVGKFAVTKVKSVFRKKTAGDVQSDANEISKESGFFADLMNKLKGASEGNDENAGLIKRGLNAISTAARAMGSAASNMMGKVASAIGGKKNEGSKEESNDNADNNQNNDNNQNAEQQNQNADEGEKVETASVHDEIDVSTDEGMAAFEAMLDDLVNGETVVESTSDSDSEPVVSESKDDDDQTSDEDKMAEESAMDEALEEFNNLFA